MKNRSFPYFITRPRCEPKGLILFAESSKKAIKKSNSKFGLVVGTKARRIKSTEIFEAYKPHDFYDLMNGK